jgi:5-methylcytosine-specific restriction endonuclease McrA
MSEFYEIDPTLENYWRSIILFGRNVASYKFALSKSLLDLQKPANTLITLEELAVPFAKQITEHLKHSDKQTTSNSSQFLDYCRSFNRNEINEKKLIEKTVQLGFVNVIDAFHNVHGQEIPTRFFEDVRKTRGGIILTDAFYQLYHNDPYKDLLFETEARWRLVETAWEMNLPKHLIQIEHDDKGTLIANNKLRRVSVTPVRPALNGYQKSRCFYCFREITIEQMMEHSAEVDHFFPHKLRVCDQTKPINGVANLVLACQQCNRGSQGKFEQLPSLELLERLNRRNEYLISSHHPLRETLIAQTGFTKEKRQNFLQDAYNCATLYFGVKHKWHPIKQDTHIF